MRTSIVCGLVLGCVLAGTALAAGHGMVEPGGKIGVMTVARGDSYGADAAVWVGGCNGWINGAGQYHRSCSVPKVPRLYIGANWAALTQKQLDDVWNHEQWRLWVDGRPVDLPRFGTAESRNFIRGKMGYFRNWRVILVDAPSGKHTIRYLWHLPSGPAALTMAVTVGK